jgi:uncharacterized protein YprB with RNaseH-like and TPR domain
MSFNPYHLKKAELLVYLTGRCKHRNPYTIDKSCFQKEILDNNIKLRIGILDIETGGLTFNADGSILLSYYIKEYHKNKYCHNRIYYKDLKVCLDKRLVFQLIKDLEKFNVIISFNGDYFDFPFIRTRSLIYGYKFIPYGYIKSIDIYKTVRHKFKLHRNSLKNTCKVFGIKGKTELDFYTWIKAISGNIKALKEIVEHNKYDVDITEELYDKIIEYERKINRSI